MLVLTFLGSSQGEDGSLVPILSRPQPSSLSSAVGLGRRAFGAVPPARKRVIDLGAGNRPKFLEKSRLGQVRGPGKAVLRSSSVFLRFRLRKARTSHTDRAERR